MAGELRARTFSIHLQKQRAVGDHRFSAAGASIISTPSDTPALGGVGAGGRVAGTLRAGPRDGEEDTSGRVETGVPKAGRLKGQLVVPDDFDKPLEELREDME